MIKPDYLARSAAFCPLKGFSGSGCLLLKACSTKIMASTSNPIHDDDGDQSPLKGRKAQQMRDRMCAAGMAFTVQSLPPGFQRAVWNGHVFLVEQLLSRSNNREGLLRDRVPLLRFSVLHLVVLGAMPRPQSPPFPMDHHRVSF